MGLTPEQRAQRNKELKAKADKRLESRGAPLFGATERDVLQMRVQMSTLLQTQKQNVEHINLLLKEKNELKERVKELHYMVRSLVDLCGVKALFTEGEFNERIRRRQLNDLALEEVDRPSEKGDHLTIRFRLTSGDTVVDDRTKTSLLYELGTGGLPCDEQFIGLKKGDTKVIEGVVFGDSFKFKEYVGKPLTLDLQVIGVHQRRK